MTFDPDKIREEQKLDKEIAEVRSQLLAGKGVDKFCPKDQLVQFCHSEARVARAQGYSCVIFSYSGHHRRSH